MARFVITITVDYDDATVLEGADMGHELSENVWRSVQRDGLLNDPLMEAIVDEWSVKVEKK